MARQFRRVITGHDETGKAVCIHDDTATAILQRPNRPGVTLTNFWRTTRTPSQIGARQKWTAQRGTNLDQRMWRTVAHDPHHIGHFQRISKALRQRLIHIRDQGGCGAACGVGSVDQSPCQIARILQRFHERARADFHIQHQSLQSCRQFS